MTFSYLQFLGLTRSYSFIHSIRIFILRSKQGYCSEALSTLARLKRTVIRLAWKQSEWALGNKSKTVELVRLNDRGNGLHSYMYIINGVAKAMRSSKNMAESVWSNVWTYGRSILFRSNEVTTTPSTVADSEILMHRQRSQIPKY